MDYGGLAFVHVVDGFGDVEQDSDLYVQRSLFFVFGEKFFHGLLLAELGYDQEVVVLVDDHSYDHDDVWVS